MAEYDTEICIIASLLPAEYIRYVSTLHEDETYAPTDEVADVPVTVEYNDGWYEPEKRSGHPDNWEPASGEDAEITSITIRDDDYSGDTELGDLGKIAQAKLVAMANEDQESSAGDHW